MAEGHTVPLAWGGDDPALPAGIDAALERGVLARRARRRSTPCARSPPRSPPDARRRGLAAELLRGMSELARRRGLRRLIAPVRPSWKERYPLTPIERYATWRREDGQLFDPWMRLHERLGARVATPLPIRCVSPAASPSGRRGPALSSRDRDYVFPHGLAPLTPDRDTDVGSYWEPNVWMIHPGAALTDGLRDERALSA